MASRRRLLLDFLFFMGPALIFSVLVSHAFSLPLSDCLHHLFWPAFAWSMSWLARLAAGAAGLRPLTWLAQFATALLWSALFWVQVGTFAALDGWGQFLTFPIVKSYATRLGPLLEVVGLDPGLAWIVPLGLMLPVVFAWVVVRRVLPVVAVPANLSRRFSMAVALGGLASGAFLYATRIVFLPFPPAEPVANLLIPGRSVETIQNWQFPVSPVRVDQEEEVRRHYRPASLPDPPDIVLIVVDALRADRMPVHGHPRNTTPYLQSLRRGGVLKRASAFRSVCAESSCGLAALARSKYPWQITGNDVSLYEVLKRHGYTNRFFLAGDHANFYGLRQVFTPSDEFVDGASRNHHDPNDDGLVLDALARLPASKGRPSFFQLHLMSAHGLGRRGQAFNKYLPQRSPYAGKWRAAIGGGDEGELVRNHYDNGLLQTDSVIERALGILRDKGYLDDALVVVTGDHGELLGEGGEYTHARTVLDPVLSPPLLYWSTRPSQPLADAPHLVSQVDVAPTILDFIGAPIPASWSGRPLGARPAGEPAYFAQGNQRGAYAEISGRLVKYVQDLNTGEETIEGIDPDSEEDARRHLRRLTEREIGPFMRGSSLGIQVPP